MIKIERPYITQILGVVTLMNVSKTVVCPTPLGPKCGQRSEALRSATYLARDQERKYRKMFFLYLFL